MYPNGSCRPCAGVCEWHAVVGYRAGMDVFARARSAALDALTGDIAGRIASYYDHGGNYADGSFLSIEPNDPARVTAADLFAVTLLNADIGPRAARRVLADDQLAVELQSVPTNIRLEDADDTTLDVAGRCYGMVKRLFVDPTAKQSEPWVAPAKLMARKCPWLLSVRDKKVRWFLGVERPYRYRADWEIYRSLMRDEEVRALLYELVVPDPPLRVLDVALWTKARQ
jgi:Family of unknown function (DUF6308)